MSFTPEQLQRLEDDLARLERTDPRVGAAFANYKLVTDKLREMPLGRDALVALADHMQRVAVDTYWLFFWAGVGTHAHAFIEFCGLLNKYVEVCRKAAEQGVDFTEANTHNEKPLPVHTPDLVYLAEKLDCIFGPLLRANPEARRVFFEKLGAYDAPPGPVYKLCTCKGHCKGPTGLGEGWICALEVPPGG